MHRTCFYLHNRPGELAPLRVGAPGVIEPQANHIHPPGTKIGKHVDNAQMGCEALSSHDNARNTSEINELENEPRHVARLAKIFGIARDDMWQHETSSKLNLIHRKSEDFQNSDAKSWFLIIAKKNIRKHQGALLKPRGHP